MSDATAPLELVPLATMIAVLRDPFLLPNTPAGTRVIFELESGEIKGDRLTGTLKGTAAADWLVIGADGTGTLDVRLLIETHDGALVFVQYNGRVDTATPGAPTYATPRFETGDERYGWLNKVQGAAKGSLDGSVLTYQLYELR
jgi:hypothetical protein